MAGFKDYNEEIEQLKQMSIEAEKAAEIEAKKSEIVLECPVVRRLSDPEDWKTDEKLRQLQKWGEEGLSYELMARNIGISRNMFLAWRNEHYEIQEAILLGREVATGHVEEALYKKATGYYIDKTVIDNKGVEHTIREWVQPDIKAIQYYLNNRCKDRWSGNIQHQTNIQVPIIFGEGNIKE